MPDISEDLKEKNFSIFFKTYSDIRSEKVSDKPTTAECGSWQVIEQINAKMFPKNISEFKDIYMDLQPNQS